MNWAELVHGRTRGARSIGTGWTGPRLVVLIDPAVEAAELAGLPSVLSAGPAVGITVICVGTDLRMLPAGCSATARITDDTGTRIAIAEPGRAPLTAIAEGVSIDWAEQLARQLAPLRDAGTDAAGRLPGQIGLAQTCSGSPTIDSAPYGYAGAGNRVGQRRRSD